ncbi:MAG TPA: ATP-binding protein [Candidatus Acidoferrales bacterium]|nr:ATP-binding protein [Candidatus Acidoferrales bacterium]
MSASATETTAAGEWTLVNRAYLDAELGRLRLLLRRRVLWLRKQWGEQPPQSLMGWVIGEAQADAMLAGEDAEAELRHRRHDPEAARIESALSETDRNTSSLRGAMDERGEPPALELLARVFELSDFECDVLLLALAPALDASFERLYAYVQDDATRRGPTPQLALALFTSGEERREAARSGFLPGAPLRRFRLLAGDSAAGAGGFFNRSLSVDDRIFDYLLGTNRLDERAALVLRPAPATLAAPSHRDLGSDLARSWQAGCAGGSWGSLHLVGPPDGGGLAVARAMCDALGIHLLILEPGRLPAAGLDRRELLALLEREAALLPMAVFVDGHSLRAEESQALRGDLEHLRLFSIIASRERWPWRRETAVVEVTKPDAGAQRAMWRQALEAGDGALDAEIDAVVEQFDFGPEGILLAAAAARARLALRSPADDAGIAREVWQACRQQASPQLDELAQKIAPCFHWEDIVLPDDVFLQLREIAAQLAHRPLVYRTWGFGAKLSRGRGISALFAGPSGTGKTTAAEVLARHLELDLYRIDLAGVVSKYIGETEKNLRGIFDAAERTGAILFFDEADALFGKRSEVKDSHDRYANIEVSYLLQRMEDYRGLAILATNRKASLDAAFLRRLRFIVDFPFPDAAHRLLIWQRTFPPQAALDGVDFAALARLELSGGNIRNIALNAAFLAAGERSKIAMSHVMRAARREYAKLEKLLPESEFGAGRRVAPR